LKPLSVCTNLEVLVLSNTSITDAGLAHLAPMQSLLSVTVQGLSVTGRPGPISDAGLAHLASVRPLRSISIPGANVSGSGLAQLRSLPNLQQLNVSSTPLKDIDVGAMAELGRQIVDIDVSGTSLFVSHGTPLPMTSERSEQGDETHRALSRRNS